MAVRRRRPLVPPPYPRRNQYTPISMGIPVFGLKRGMTMEIVTHPDIEVCYNSMKFS